MSQLYIAVAIFLAGLGFGGASAWKVQTWRHDSAALKATQDAAAAFKTNAAQTFRLAEVKDAESIRINDRLADALERLRKRPERRAAAATPACEGATGAQLSGPDGAFLEREAARADQLRTALGECYGWIDAVTTAPPR